MDLGEILTQEEKDRILNEVERKKLKNILYRKYRQNVPSGDRFDYDVALHMGNLIGYDDEMFIRLCEDATNIRIRTSTEIDIMNMILTGSDLALGNLAKLAECNPSKFMEFFNKHVSYGDKRRKELAIAKKNKNPIFIPIHWDMDPDIEYMIGKQIKGFAKSDKTRYLNLCDEILDSGSNAARRAVASQIEMLVSIDPKKYIKLCKNLLNDEDFLVRCKLVDHLDVVAKYDLGKFLKLLNKSFKDKSDDVKTHALKHLDSINVPREYYGKIKKIVKLANKVRYRNDFWWYEEDSAKISSAHENSPEYSGKKELDSCLDNIRAERVIPIEDDKYKFFKIFLSSPHLSKKVTDKEGFEKKLLEFLEKDVDFSKLVRIAPHVARNEEKCDNLDEIVECSKFDEIIESRGIIIHSVLNTSSYTSKVYRGYDPELGRDVIVKVTFDEPLIKTPNTLRLSSIPLERRLRTLSQTERKIERIKNLLHQIVAADGRAKNYIWRVYEDAGQTLISYYKNIKNEEKNAYFVHEYILSLVSTIKEMHDSNLVHRDIKPENLFVSGSLEKPIAVLGDTDTIRHMNDINERREQGSIMETIGSPTYMSPEAISDYVAVIEKKSTAEMEIRKKTVNSIISSEWFNKLVSERTAELDSLRPDFKTVDWKKNDIFEIGVLLYEMVTGKKLCSNLDELNDEKEYASNRLRINPARYEDQLRKDIEALRDNRYYEIMKNILEPNQDRRWNIDRLYCELKSMK